MAEITHIGALTAFAAGLVSFLSPCVLPLVPGYVSYVAGISLSQGPRSGAIAVRLPAMGLSLCFVLGFSTIFVALGASATALGQALLRWRYELNLLGGAAVMLFGLFTIGAARIAVLERDFRFHLDIPGGGPIAAYVLGLAFGFGWTPCIGPILGAILTMAGTSGQLSTGVLLLVAYGLGLGVPFFVAAVGFSTFLTGFKRIRGWLRPIEVASGVVLVAVGFLIFTNYFAVLAAMLNRWILPLFPFISENI